MESCLVTYSSVLAAIVMLTALVRWLMRRNEVEHHLLAGPSPEIQR